MDYIPSPEEIEALRLAVSRLPPKQYSVFVARKWEGLGYPEIAARFRMSPRAVERHMARAFRNIWRQLDGLPVIWWHRFL